MNISGLNPSAFVPQISPGSASSGLSGASGPGSSFGSVVRDAVESLDQSQKASAQEVAKAVTGESPDLHKTIIALQTADLGFQFALQVRNKVISAYEEIMRMQV
jgi:flagellar hook-basal body complex protein FliE